MNDADVVQAFLVADDVLRRGGPIVTIGDMRIACDARMPMTAFAGGTPNGNIVVVSLGKGRQEPEL